MSIFYQSAISGWLAVSVWSNRSHSITEVSFPTAAFSVEDGLCWHTGTEEAEKPFQPPSFCLANRLQCHNNHQDQIQEMRCTLPGAPDGLGCAPRPFPHGLWGTTAGSSSHNQEHGDLSGTLMNAQHLTQMQQEGDFHVIGQLLFF